MRQIILDHYRRWSLVLALCAVLEFALGCLIASGQQMFEFSTLFVAIWAGGTLLSFDLKKGELRFVATLPLTGRQIGRACWMASVLIPAIALTLLLFAGAATYRQLHPDQAFSIRNLVLASLFTWIWLGIGFCMVFAGTRTFVKNRGEFLVNLATNWIAIVAFFGSMVFCNGAAKDPLRAGIILGVGFLLTLVGWRRAENFEPARAGTCIGRIESPKLSAVPRLTPLERKLPSELFRAPIGNGGLPYLLKTNGLPIAIMGLATAAMIMLFCQWQGQMQRDASRDSFLRMMIFMAFWFAPFSQYVARLQQLRFLRTLPISTTQLAITLMALLLLPVIIIGAGLAAGAECFLGPSAAFVVIQSATLTLAPTAFCAFIAIAVGNNKMLVITIVMVLFVVVIQNALSGISLSLTAFIAFASILVAFFLTRHALSRSHHPYMTAPLAQ